MLVRIIDASLNSYASLESGEIILSGLREDCSLSELKYLNSIKC
jgi:hypothetical protein